MDVADVVHEINNVLEETLSDENLAIGALHDMTKEFEVEEDELGHDDLEDEGSLDREGAPLEELDTE